MKSAKKTIESPSRIEPARIENIPENIADLIAEVSAAGAALGVRLHPKTAANLADIVRLMNSYYSNLIEGHNTRPRDIERALQGDFDEVEQRRNLQREALSHIQVQADIDEQAHRGTLPDPTSIEFIKWLHKRFYEDAPQQMLTITSSRSTFIMTPGEWRSEPEHDVQVGRHLPPSSDHVESFMQYFHQRYAIEKLRKGARVLAMAAAHHRFNYIHPFPDGNGRVSRLMSHAMAHHAEIGAHGLWSVSRGLARGLNSRTDYKTMMDLADSPRRGDHDGRGNLSLKALEEFTEWFLAVCLDQINFMSSLFDLNQLSARLEKYVQQSDRLKPQSLGLLKEALIRGEVERGDAARVTGLPERSARRVLNDLIAEGLLASDSPKTPVSLRFPTATHEILFPRLFPVS